MAKNKKKTEWRVQVVCGGYVVQKRETDKNFDYEDSLVRVCESGEVIVDTIVAEFPELDACSQFTITAK